MMLWASLGAVGLGSGASAARVRTLRPTSEPTRGAWGWTDGEQTYLRVRPSKSDPIVAKVPHATKVFVWGKFNGWYRVETPDHKFGWVYHDFLKCPKANKVAPLTHFKAAQASNRASSQTLYGSTSTLRTYYARHRSSGAARGLAQHGVRLASSSKPPKASAAKASAAHKARLISLSVASKGSTPRPAPRLAQGARPFQISSPAKPSMLGASRIASLSGHRIARPGAHAGARGASATAPAGTAASSSERPLRLSSASPFGGEAPRLSSGAHFGVRPSTRVYSNPPQVLAPRGSELGDRLPDVPAPVDAPDAPDTSSDVAGAIVLDAPPAARGRAPRPAARPKIVKAPTKARPVPRAVVRAASRPAPRVAARPVAAKPTLAARPAFAAKPALAASVPRAAPSISIAEAPVPLATVPVAVPSVAPSAARTPLSSIPAASIPAAKPVTRVVAKPAGIGKPVAPKMTASQIRARSRQQRQAWLWKQQRERRSSRLASRGASRDRLRTRMGTVMRKGVPPLAPSMRPISPDELMRARDSHLAGRLHKPSGSLADAASGQGAPGGLAPGSSDADLSPTSSLSRRSPLSRPEGAQSRAEDASVSPSSYEMPADGAASHASYQMASYEPETGSGMGGAIFSLASYTVGPRSKRQAERGSRWAAPQDGPDASPRPSAEAPSSDSKAAARGAATVAAATASSVASASSRAGSPRDRMLAGARLAQAAGGSRPSGLKPNVIASRGRPSASGTARGSRGGSPRGAYSAGVRGGSPRDAYAAQRRASGTLFGETMASQAMAYRGTPYRSGGASPGGFDCSGLVYFLLRQRGITPPRTAAGLASFGRPVSKADLQAGDIVLFANTYKRGVSHVGIYQGNGLFVHAPHSGARVRTDALFSGYYNAKYWGARRPR